MDFPQLPFLELLRPESGWRTDRALISTYSAQVSVIAAALLSLAGEVDEAGSGSRVGLVRALTRLRGKVKVILQPGRLVPQRHDAAVVALFDRFLLQVPWDESVEGHGQSWHAKFALVRQVAESDANPEQERWLFILGSRNLTRDLSWDIGFSIRGGAGWAAQRDHCQQSIDGIATLADDLARLFPDELAPWAALATRLQEASWWVSNGCAVSKLQLMLPGTSGRALPSPPVDPSRLVAVSPFMDIASIRTLMRWPVSVQRQLLSTHNELSRVLAGVGLQATPALQALALAESELDTSLDEQVAKTESTDDLALEPQRLGLHAKMLYVEHAGGGTLWLGSPNLTDRAWTRNAEAFVQVDGVNKRGNKLLRDGVDALLSRAVPVALESLQSITSPDIAERLAKARNYVAAQLLSAKQTINADGSVRLQCANPPHGSDKDIALHCGQVLGDLVEWKAGSCFLGFPKNAVAVESQCVSCRLSLENSEVVWIQLVTFDPPLDLDERDAKVLSAYLGSRQMLAWIHAVLNGWSDGDEGGTWDSPSARGRGGSRAGDAIELPSLEQALRMWLREPARLEEVDQILALRRQGAPTEDGDASKELSEFCDTWNILRRGLPRMRS